MKLLNNRDKSGDPTGRKDSLAGFLRVVGGEHPLSFVMLNLAPKKGSFLLTATKKNL